MTGGTFEGTFEVNQGTATIEGGSFRGGRSLEVNNNSVVNITGGDFSTTFTVEEGSDVSISGGVFGGTFTVGNRGSVDISGGTFDRIFLQGTAELNLSGGTVSGLVTSNSGDLNIFGTEFFIDGDLVEFLALGETLNLRGQDLTLAGTLLDGSDFEIQFGSGVSSQSFVNSVNLTLSTAVPEPSSLMLLITCFGLGTLKRRRPPATR